VPVAGIFEALFSYSPELTVLRRAGGEERQQQPWRQQRWHTMAPGTSAMQPLLAVAKS
jgi:hypothetical protein